MSHRSSLHRLWFTAALVLVTFRCALAQHPAKADPHANSEQVVMLSDIHLDVFHDPTKFARINAAPAAEWASILNQPDAPTQQAEFDKLHTACPVKGIDTPPLLLSSALEAAHERSPHALFVTVSGDLLAHAFDCKFHTLAPSGSAADYSAFAAKTIAMIALALHKAFPATSIYVALGNNDSGCGDYKESADSAFLAQSGKAVAALLPEADRNTLLHGFANEGDYSEPLPKPILRGRLIVLQDLFEATRYTSCDGKPSAHEAETQIAWLRTELIAARSHHEQVWVMAHMPPGIDVYSTVTKARDVCSGTAPDTFLASQQLANVLTEFSDVVRLAVFAHTHMDEMHLLHSQALGETKDHAGEVAVKLVPSISPILGNKPSFLVAVIDPRTAILRDYAAIIADNPTGIATKWAEEYRFSSTYKLDAYTPQRLTPLLSGMSADKAGETAAARDYLRYFFPGENKLLRLVWPAYACALTNSTADGYRTCSCPAKP